MKLPRWTVYPAIAVLMLMAVTAVPHAGESGEHEGAARRLRRRQLEQFEARAAGIEACDEAAASTDGTPTDGTTADGDPR